MREKLFYFILLPIFLVVPLACSSHPRHHHYHLYHKGHQYCSLCHTYHDPRHEHFKPAYEETVVAGEQPVVVQSGVIEQPVVAEKAVVPAHPVLVQKVEKLQCTTCGAYYTPKYYCRVCRVYYHSGYHHRH